jgi:hypothetical protein
MTRGLVWTIQVNVGKHTHKREKSGRRRGEENLEGRLQGRNSDLENIQEL